MEKTIKGYKKFLLFFISFWFIISFPTLSFASEKKSLEYWLNEYKKNPTNNLALFNIGVSYQLINNNILALKTYKKLISKGSPLTPIAYYYISQIYLEEGDAESARIAINKIDINKLPPKTKNRILAFKNSLFTDNTEVERNSSWSGNFKAGLGMNSNPQFISNDDTSNSIEQDEQVMLLANINYESFAGNNYDLDFNYQGNLYSFNEKSESSFSTNSIGTQLSFYTPSIRFMISPNYTFQSFGGKAFSSIYSATSELKVKLWSNYFAIGISYDSIDISNDDYFYLSGQSLKPYSNFQFNLYGLFMNLRYQRQNNNFQDSDTVSPSFTADTFNLSIYKKIQSWSFNIYSQFQDRVYNYDITEGMTREDQRWIYGLELNYFITSSWSLFASGFLINNSSNFDQNTSDDKNYNQLSVITGIHYGL